MTAPLKLKIALQGLPHKCERTLLVPQDCTMLQLHFMIQESFGWLNAHLFEFSDTKGRPNIRVGVPSEFDDEFDFIDMAPKKDLGKTKLKETFLYENQRKPFWYWYDFGDDWWNRISFLNTTLKDLKQFEGGPICFKTVGKCPSEDVGDPWGYADFLEIIKDKKHPNHKESARWCGLKKGEVYYENEVDLAKINNLLKKYYTSKAWKATLDDLFK